LVEDLPVPDPNEEYFLYQTLLGAWPLEPVSAGQYAEFVQRIQGYLRKAIHEAKVHTSWVNPNPAYDAAMEQFIERILDPQQSEPFLHDLRVFLRRITHFGLFNSLAQTLLKLTAPGVPDTYQGTELWDFSLVDPDNRRPVDYPLRRKLLQELLDRLDVAGDDCRSLARELTEHRLDGRIKLYVTMRTLRYRRDHPGLFTRGDYLPLKVVRSRQDHVYSFARQLQDRCVVIAIPRLLAQLMPNGERPPLGPGVWGDAALVRPDGCGHTRWRNLFTGAEVLVGGPSPDATLPLAEVFADFPVALLVKQP
jgi:(1->4)-alpha-D-glucan 1-alpha-D-glucosylmutase